MEEVLKLALREVVGASIALREAHTALISCRPRNEAGRKRRYSLEMAERVAFTRLQRAEMHAISLIDTQKV